VTTLFLCGAGNSEGVRLAQRVAAQRREWQRIVLLDDDPQKHGTALLGVPIEGPIDALRGAPAGAAAVNLVARRTGSRAAVHRRIVDSGVPLATLVHPGVDAADCELGAGVLVYEQAILSPETKLGFGACALMRSIIGHGASVGAGCVIAPGAVLNARVVLGERVYVGSNASVLPDVKIGDDALIGANTMVAQDVTAGATVVGVPGVVLAAAPAPAEAARPVVEDHGPPTPAVLELQARLLGLLHTVLGDDRAGPNDHFFDVGGTSLRAIQFLEAVRSATGHEVPLLRFYARCTVRDLAAELAGPGGGSAAQAATARAQLRRRMSGWGGR
jgi:sugar O-acyltransferase (sialic acid O-acetyltransferase NeuD family)